MLMSNERFKCSHMTLNCTVNKTMMLCFFLKILMKTEYFILRIMNSLQEKKYSRAKTTVNVTMPIVMSARRKMNAIALQKRDNRELRES